MSEAVSLLFWLDESYSHLDNLPWSKLEADPVRIRVQSFSNKEKDIKHLVDAATSEQIVVVVYELEGEDELETLSKGLIAQLPASVVLFLISPIKLLDQVKEAAGTRPRTAILQQPIRHSELFLLLEKSILVEYFRHRADDLGHEEEEWLSRVEHVFELSRQELLDRERTQAAFEKLIEYEEHLLEEQRRINQALMSLQDYRDHERLEWEQEKKALDQVDSMRTEELRNRDQTVMAQETLLELSRRENMDYHRLLAEFEKKGTLGKNEIQKLFDEHKNLITKIEDLSH